MNLLITLALLSLVILAWIVRRRNEHKSHLDRDAKTHQWWKDPPGDAPEGDY